MRTLSKILISLLLITFLLLNLHQLWFAILWLVKHLSFYKWLGVGIAAYFVLRLLFRKNEEWLQTQTHEWTHVFVALLFGHKIHYSYAQEGSGEMSHSGRFGGLFISLAPYCFPIFTYLFLLMRIIGSWQSLYIFDILIGFTAAFHAHCFRKQTGPYQPDIQAYGLPLSYLFITAFLLFNACVIVLSVKMGIVNAYERLISQYWKDIIMVWKSFS
ncbi:hypothetical protein AGMMS50239_21780 [Bacteroidia bacterium]|nr:hypothetical protein AGMMS50239_21780 [Bacteroidia bacterium]